jgi:hypothetical protein
MRSKWFRNIIILAIIGLMLLPITSCSSQKTIKIGAISL